jgi:ribulose-5-phosphate 4-epimerase/fuculose-1-phosphate aldolase
MIFMHTRKDLLDDLRIATKILVKKGVIDGFGHVSVRSRENPDHYFMIRNNSGLADDESNIVELDSDSNPIQPGGPRPSIERFIHGEIYRERKDVQAIVHTHAPSLIPFGVSKTPLRPLYHLCGFLGDGAPVFDIEHQHGMTDLLVTSSAIGKSLADTLKKNAVVLMRGHGATVVGASVQEAVFRAVYTMVNAQLQPVAMQLGEPKFLATEEAEKADKLHQAVLSRPWDFWKNELAQEK